MNIQQLGDVLQRYLAGAASDEEKKLVEQWQQERPEDHVTLDPQHRRAVEERLWQSFTARTDWQPPPARTILFSRKWQAYAAAVTLLVACAFWLQPTGRRTPAMQTIAALPGSHKKVTLPDSSVAHLFPGATITVPEDYNDHDRRIALSGRVFFEVKPDQARPFQVSSGKMVTRVLGTSFEVSTPDSLHTSVTVRSGKVGVQYDGRPLAELLPGKRLRFHTQHNDFTIDDVNAAQLCEWWNNGMVFHQAPLAEVVQSLSDWYNVPIVISQAKWRQETVTIRIRRQSCDDAMALLSATLGFRYKKDNRRIIIY
ncbi:FecR family protein [Chitinophaga sp. GCM10012297]|uniref:DUF4974 domain-containing protein n=1 Tax=Chitinophaga chungangae TaxID=2821488 RepID=A0ABS3YFR3_9BACT|nr:FecR domain-containing protein [Chitinophaga chungangae]MBO9153523.1 DUF4974 domain-containing protein [Chitinophaga chungangae]